MKARILGLLAVALVVGPLTARSAALFSFIETGGDVVGTLSGSINLTNAVSVYSSPIYDSGLFVANASVTPGVQLQASDMASSDDRGTFWRLAGPATFGGTGNLGTPGTLAGPGVFELLTFGNPALGLLSTYSGEALSNTLTFTNKTFSSLGVAAGDYVYALAGSGDTVTIRFQRTSVPEPGTLALLALGLLGLGMSRRKA